MSIKHIIVATSFLSVILSGCTPSSLFQINESMNMSKNYAIFPADDFIFFHSAEGYDKIKRYTPSDEEAQMSIDLLATYIEDKQSLFANYLDKNPDIKLENYKIQLSGYFNDQNDLIIQVNCIHENSAPENWQSEMVWMDDGGNAYFEATINFTQAEVLRLRVNGLA